MNMAATRNTAFAFLMAASLAACGGTSSGPVMEHKIGLVYFGPDESADMCMKGLFDGLKEQASRNGSTWKSAGRTLRGRLPTSRC